MLKILVSCTVACIISTSPTLAVAADMLTPKAASTSLQKVKLNTQKSFSSQLDRFGMPSRDRAINPPSHSANDSPNHSKVMPVNAQLGLLLTALLCFVARASRRKV